MATADCPPLNWPARLRARLGEMFCRLVYETIAELRLYRRPPPIAKVDDGIRLEACLVAVVKYLAV